MLLSVESPRGAELEVTCWERLGRGEVLIRQTMKSIKIKQKKYLILLCIFGSYLIIIKKHQMKTSIDPHHTINSHKNLTKGKILIEFFDMRIVTNYIITLMNI